MHICKMLHVTATKDECFTGHLSVFMRISVFVLVPLPHMIFLIFVTVFSGTVGMLYYIGKSTRIVYNHEYRKTMKDAKSNARLEPKSHLGKYYKQCQEFMKDDEKSYPTIYALKACTASVPGILIGIFPFVPFSIAMVAITLLRLPINLYKTMKITLFTIVLKWDLKITALITLPLIHGIFPLVVLIQSLVLSLCYFTFRTSRNIYEGYNPFMKWGWFQDRLLEYYKAHQEFVGERCNNNDHPSGIPLGWQGQRYGVPVAKILRWQWDFIMCCFLVIYSIPIGFVGLSVISIIRLPPSIFFSWKKISSDYSNSTCLYVMGNWPFYIAKMLFAPLWLIMFFAGLVIVAVTILPFISPYRYLEDGFLSGLYEPFRMVAKIGETSDRVMNYTSEWRALPCLKVHHIGGRSRSNSKPGGTDTSDKYWDRFISQCIKTTSELIEAKWITAEDVESMDPAVITSIPAVAILNILVDSTIEKGLKKEDIKWSIDGTTCKKEDRPMQDAILEFFWPLVYDMKNILLSNKRRLVDRVDARVIMAMLCDNGEDSTNELKEFLTSNEMVRSSPQNILLRSKATNFVLQMTRVGPYLNRMSKIYTYEYITDVEKGNCKIMSNISISTKAYINEGSEGCENKENDKIIGDGKNKETEGCKSKANDKVNGDGDSKEAHNEGKYEKNNNDDVNSGLEGDNNDGNEDTDDQKNDDER